MGIYIGLLVIIIVLSIFINSLEINKEMKKEYFLKIAFLLIFLLYSLRSSSVGRDLPGYERSYFIASTRDWLDYSYVYFEKGYIFLMKICNLIGLSFQEFLVIVNFIILVPIYIFIKKYSKRPFLSVIIYICYIFFEFNLTGIRQAIASSIVLLGIIALIESQKYKLLKYIIIIYLATLFHKGAFIGFFYVPFYFIKKQRNYVAVILILMVSFVFFRGNTLSFIKEYFGKTSMNANAGMYIGLNFIFIVGLAVLMAIGEKNRRAFCNKFIKKNKKEELINSTFNKMFLLSIVALILFGSDNSVRSYMILNQVILVQFPNCIDKIFKKNNIKLVITIITVFFIVFFFKNTLIGGDFDIVPYKFYWE